MRKSVFNVSGGYNLNSDSSYDSDEDQEHRRLQLVNFGHSHWGFNNWSWCVNKQDLDFVDHTNNKYCAGVVAFVTISVKTLDIHRENIGYAVCSATSKGNAIYRARKNAVTNALRETFLSFGGNIALSLQDAPVVEVSRAEEAPRGLTPPANTRLRPAAPAAPAHPGAPAHAPPAHGPPAPPPPHASAVPSSPNKSNVTASACAGRARAGPAGGPLSSAAQTCAAGGAGGTLGAPRSNSNESKVEEMTDEEVRAERKRRQRQAQEEFRQRQCLKHCSERNKKQYFWGDAFVNPKRSTAGRRLRYKPMKSMRLLYRGYSSQSGRKLL